MRKVYDWVIQFLGVVFITVTVVPCVLGFLLFAVLFIGVNLLEWDLEPDGDARAVAALQNTGMTAYVDYAPYHAMVVDNSLSAFILPKYDNHTDKTDLRAGIMACAAELPNWHVEAFSCDKYAAKLNVVFTEAAFLLPADVTFDAWYEDADRLAFFDQDTGLMVQLKPETQPHTGRIKEAGLTIPHDGFTYEYESHGGFHGDGVSYRALCIPAQERRRVAAQIAAAWQPGPVTAAEYCMLHARQVYASLPLYPAADVTFDWWFFSDDYAAMYPDKGEAQAWGGDDFPQVMQAQHAHASPNWTMGFYDEETGLLILYEYDS